MIMYEPPVGGSIFVAWLRGRFDAYLITFDDRFRMVVSERLKEAYMDENTRAWINSYKGKEIALPESFKPSKVFLEYHNDVIFDRW